MPSVRDPLPADFAHAFEIARPLMVPLATRILFFESTPSTNDVALDIVAEGTAEHDAEGVIVIADRQGAGRGRQGRVWHSPPRTGLYVSVVLRPSRGQSGGDRATRLLTLAAGVALAEGIETATGFRAAIKWPNDLLSDRRKLAGILAEAAGQPGYVVLGYGINVSARSFPPDLDGRATSLELELGREVDRASVCTSSLAALSRRYQDLLNGQFDAILQAWRARSPSSHGASVAWSAPSGRRDGITSGIDEDGALMVRVPGGSIERIVGGEVTWL